MEEILLVAPYPKLAEVALQLRSKINREFALMQGEADEPFEKQISPSTRVIISRGGMAKTLRSALELPIIEVPVTTSDILKAVSEVTKYGFKKIAVITPSNIMFRGDRSILLTDELELQFETGEDFQQIANIVKNLVRNDQVDAIIGDRVATQLALKQGIHGYLLESGEQSLLIALETASNLISAQNRERAKVKEMESILNRINEAVLSIDPSGTITIYNESAKRIFGFMQEHIIGKKYSDCFTDEKLLKMFEVKTEQHNFLYTISNGKKVLVNHIPIYVDDVFQGSVGIFEEISKIQNLELKIRKSLNDRGLIAKNTFNDIVTINCKMLEVVQEAKLYAHSEGTVLIYGETGTGKELFAQSIHNASRRNHGPFVSVNCAALNENLLESELFGYEEGAFTGAIKGGRAGLFELAHGGSLFLDEIGEISPQFQAKLLRVLQEKEVRRIGADRIIPIDVRIICATNKSLFELVKEGKFREDLYYRLCILELDLIPLRYRKEDIIPMAISFLKTEAARENRTLIWQDDHVFTALLEYSWLGNARELHNFIHKLVICSPDGELTSGHIKALIKVALKRKGTPDKIEIEVSKDFRQMEKEMWRHLLELHNGDKDLLCETYNISRTTLWRKINFENES